MPRTYYVYILANRSKTLYVGVTSDPARRILQHRSGTASHFTRQYMVRRLVHIESTSNPRDAIAREKQIKQWTRAKKVALIEADNPQWADLAAVWLRTALYRDSEDSSPSARNDTTLCRDDEDSSLRSE